MIKRHHWETILQYNIIHAKDPVTSLMEDYEQCAEIDPSLIAEFQYGIASVLAETEWEDLPNIVPISSQLDTQPMLKKNFLDLVVERYEAEIKLLNSQERPYQFKDPRAFWKVSRPLKMKKLCCFLKYKKDRKSVV